MPADPEVIDRLFTARQRSIHTTCPVLVKDLEHVTRALDDVEAELAETKQLLETERAMDQLGISSDRQRANEAEQKLRAMTDQSKGFQMALASMSQRRDELRKRLDAVPDQVEQIVQGPSPTSGGFQNVVLRDVDDGCSPPSEDVLEIAHVASGMGHPAVYSLCISEWDEGADHRTTKIKAQVMVSAFDLEAALKLVKS